MIARVLCMLSAHGGAADVRVEEDEDGRIEFLADGDIDADGANGHGGGKPAYMVGDNGSEFLANGGMKMVGGKVVGAQPWFKDIVILGANGQPAVFPGGIIASKTSYRMPGASANDPAAYVDAETVPYGVLSPTIIQAVHRIVKGCRMRITNTRNGKSVEAVMADIGPRAKIGELSIAAARAIGIAHSPRSGGESEKVIKYEIWPGVPAVVNGVTYQLQAS